MQLLDLPDVVIEDIFRYLDFDEVAKLRIVSRTKKCMYLDLFLFFIVIFKICKRFNKINQEILNHGFYKLTNNHAKQIRRIKTQLPRRESERSKESIKSNVVVLIYLFLYYFKGNHPLSKYSDILTCVETRLSMLSMTYLKYMQNGSACFIPGKVRYRVKIDLVKILTDFF